jgi:WD40 repeat protein
MTKKENRYRNILTIPVEEGVPYSVDWSPDGTHLVVGDSYNGTAVWTVEGEQLWRCIEHSNKIYCAKWAPNGLYIASASYDKAIRVYDAVSGKVTHRFDASFGNNQVAWSPDSTRLAWAVKGDGIAYIICIFDAVTGRPLTNCSGHYLPIKCVSWSPKGNVLASGSDDYTVHILESTTGSCLRVLEGHNDFIDDLCWSPCGNLLASASNDNTIRVWNSTTGECILVYKGHTGCIDSVSWSPDGRLMASGSGDNSVRLWNITDGATLLEFDNPDWVNAVAFSPDGSRLASACADGYVRLFHVSDLVQVKKKAAAPDITLEKYITLQAATIGFCPSALAKKEPWVPHLPEAEGDCLGVLRYPNKTGYLPSVALFPDGRSITTGHGDGMVQRWDLQTGSILWQGTEKHTNYITDIVISPDGAHIATASSDKTLITWDAATGQCLKYFKRYISSGLKVRWSPDGKRLASLEYSFEKQLSTWDAETGECLWIGEGHTEPSSGLDWSPNGQFIATGDNKGNIIIWDAYSGQNLHWVNNHKEAIWNLRWSPDSRFLLTGFNYGTVLVMKPLDRSIRYRLQGHIRGVTALDWSRDGRFIATGARGDDKNLRVWDAETGLELKCFTFSEYTCSKLAFSPDSAFIVASLSGKGEDVFRIWDTRFLLENKAAKTVTDEAPPAPSSIKPLPENLRKLPAALAQMQRLTIYPPLSLVRDMLQLLADSRTDETGDTADSLQSLFKQNPGLLALRDLRWPFAARIGLVVFLLHRLPPTPWKPPPGSSPSQVRDALLIALTGDPIEPKPPAPPISLLFQAANQIDDRLLTLLSLLGPDAVAADPGLPLRLLPRVKEIPPLSISQRRRLGIRTGSPQMSGQSTGLTPSADRGQIGDIQMGPLRNDFTLLLPTQLAMPPLVQMYRHLRNELLFRAREMAEPPRIRPAVILLDVSPPSFGPIEKITRLAAFTIAQSIRRAGQRVILLTNSDGIKEGQWLLELNHPADLLETWLQRTLKPIPAGRSLHLARVLRAGLQENEGLEPIILVLSHPWFGAEEDIPQIKGLRGLFVQYPHYPVVPVLSGKCEKWRTIETTQPNELTSLLTQLMT